MQKDVNMLFGFQRTPGISTIVLPVDEGNEVNVKNVLWIMADQLRWDYLSCYGHPHLHTPHIDALAARGVLFNRAYVNSPICGSSRMCYYTGRYSRSHGATWNFIPLRIGCLLYTSPSPRDA